MPNLTSFPHLTSTGPPPSARDVAFVYRQSFSKLVEAGTLRPFVFPYHMYGYVLLMIYLCIPHTKRPWLYTARWLVLGVISAFQWKTLWQTSSASPAISFAAGLVAAWIWVWAWVWLIFYRPQSESKRVQRRETSSRIRSEAIAGISTSRENGHVMDRPNGDSTLKQRRGGPSHRAEENGAVLRKSSEILETPVEANGRAQDAGTSSSTLGRSLSNGKVPGKGVEVEEYYWQSYPDKLGERISWVIDLVLNFRGPGWNWAIDPLPLPPLYISQQLGGPIDDSSRTGRSFTGLKCYNTRRELFRARFPQFIIGYFVLDALKVLLMKDPYFIFGPNTYDLPPLLQHLHPEALRFVRQVESACVIIVTLEMLLFLAPLGMSSLLGPKVLGQRAEAWYYPTTWGSFSIVLDKGLNGLWGSWWHQTFRFAFAAPTVSLESNGYIHARSKATKLIALFFAFGISGLLHAGGSITQLPHSHPSNPMYFFMSQILGIFIQAIFCTIFHPSLKALPKTVRRTGNLVFAVGWMFYTGWLLTDDFARGGVWLYEPIPFSPLRGLGFGGKGDGWWCWGDHIGIGWYTGKHWWESGIAI
ncbi:uncharacterized protein BP5553_00061 [Venustampulla echinocandica]|uniref:Wax synthase domain-containing protein n=1 Tax=Venustampulla echinocandica TaxID=2656787 RepID=A0A370TX26_9HELO|nr:uncharacterized protein BP5553_00061 [Venustampulla echinocandica]RDL40082.1 hypothetical protein BP5553_00061 [Venustampulla echinocandica]